MHCSAYASKHCPELYQDFADSFLTHCVAHRCCVALPATAVSRQGQCQKTVARRAAELLDLRDNECELLVSRAQEGSEETRVFGALEPVTAVVHLQLDLAGLVFDSA